MAGKVLAVAALAATALAAPLLEERQSCATTWQQCGGQGYNGPTSCCAGSTCVMQNQWYSQCLPGAATTTSQQATTSATSSRSSASQTSASSTASTTTSVVIPSTTVKPSTTSAPVVPSGTVQPGKKTASYTGNPLADVTMWANSFYSSEVHSLAIPSMTGAMATKAAAVAKVPSFQWLDRNITLSTLMPKTLAEVRAANEAGGNYAALLVVYDLPDRDCSAAASNGEFSIANGGAANYKTYIAEIKRQLQLYSDVRTILIIEPDSLANMVTNMNVAKCQGAASTYKELTVHALKELNLPNVAMYMDGGHGGWLGWPANIGPAAELFAQIYKDAGKPKSVRGIVTNVSNYNGWSLPSAPSYTTPNPNYDEKRFVEAFAPLLKAGGFEAKFLVDQGRSGKQPTGQIEQGHWCNAIGTGFGMRPTASTGHDDVDAFVWVKPGGESDGTSNTSAARYDHHCGEADALKPAPEAGQWFQAYFEQLLTNANPPF